MDDDTIEQKLIEFLTPPEVNIPPQLELDNSQLDSKIVILKEQQDQIMQVLKINYWDQLKELVGGGDDGGDNTDAGNDADAGNNTANDAATTEPPCPGLPFLNAAKSQVNPNLYHHLSKMYSIRKMNEEYEYVRRNNINYTTV